MVPPAAAQILTATRFDYLIIIQLFNYNSIIAHLNTGRDWRPGVRRRYNYDAAGEWDPHPSSPTAVRVRLRDPSGANQLLGCPALETTRMGEAATRISSPGPTREAWTRMLGHAAARPGMLARVRCRLVTVTVCVCVRARAAVTVTGTVTLVGMGPGSPP